MADNDHFIENSLSWSQECHTAFSSIKCMCVCVCVCSAQQQTLCQNEKC